jgi:hypothetical protein
MPSPLNQAFHFPDLADRNAIIFKARKISVSQNSPLNQYRHYPLPFRLSFFGKPSGRG